jgi:hypothetical protein
MNYFFLILDGHLHMLGVCGDHRYLFSLSDVLLASAAANNPRPSFVEVAHVELPTDVIANHMPAYMTAISHHSGGARFFEVRELGDEGEFLAGTPGAARVCILSTAVFNPSRPGADDPRATRWQPWTWVHLDGLISLHYDEEERERRLWATSGGAHALVLDIYAPSGGEESAIQRKLVLVQFPLMHADSVSTCAQCALCLVCHADDAQRTRS